MYKKSEITNQKVIAVYYLSEWGCLVNITWEGGIDTPKVNTIQKSKTSTFPFSISKFGTRQFSIQKLWVNNQLVFEKTLENPRIPFKFNLTYQGEDKHHVKVAFHNTYDMIEIYKERIFDFQIQTCN